LAIGNFLSLSITVSNALDRAANGGSPQKAQLEIQTSSVVRPLVSGRNLISYFFRRQSLLTRSPRCCRFYLHRWRSKYWSFSVTTKKAVILHHEWP